MTDRQLKLGAILIGVGIDHDTGRDPQQPGDASVDIGWHIQNARLAEAAIPQNRWGRPAASLKAAE